MEQLHIGLDRINRIFRIVFSQFPDETEKESCSKRNYHQAVNSVSFSLQAPAGLHFMSKDIVLPFDWKGRT